MKKILPVFLAFIIFLNPFTYQAKVFAEAAPKLPPEIVNPVNCPGGTKKCYYVKNPNTNKPKLTLVPPRSTPPTTASPKIGNIAGMVLSVFLSTPEGQEFLKKGATYTDGLANKLGTQIQKLSDVEKAALVSAYDSMKSGASATIDLGTTLYNKVFDLMNGAFKGTNMNSTVPDSTKVDLNQVFEIGGHSFTYRTDTPIPYVVRVIGVINTDNQGGKYVYVVLEGYYHDLWVGERIKFNNGVYVSKTTPAPQTKDYVSTVDKTYTQYQYDFNSYITYNDMPITDYYSLKNHQEAWQNPNNGSVAMPQFPDETTVPGIVEMDEQKYWEIPSPYEDGQENKSYVPVNDPAAKPEKEVIIINDGGYEVAPDGKVSEEPITQPVPKDPEGGGGTPGENPKKIDWTKLTPALAALMKVFPFSIPWDFKAFFSQFNVEPQTPKIPIKIDKQLPITEGKTIPFKIDFVIDFSMFDVIAKITRWGLIIAFDIYLITSLRKYTPD